jgi:hypothetical protein
LLDIVIVTQSIIAPLREKKYVFNLFRLHYSALMPLARPSLICHVLITEHILNSLIQFIL